jgi:small ubiquitin-related modifier
VLLCRKRARAEGAGIAAEAAARSKPAVTGSTGGALGLDADPPINIIIRDQLENEVFFKLRCSTRLGKVFDAYAQKTGVCINTLKFIFDGKRTHSEMTPGELEMEDGDSMDVTIEQYGD